MISIKKLSPIILACLTAISVPTVTQAETLPDIVPQAQSILQKSSDFLKKQPSLRFQAEITFDDVLPPAFKIQYNATIQVMVRRPNGLRVEYRGDRRNADFYYNGKTLTLWDKTANVYGVVATPATIDATLSGVIDKYDFSLPLADFLTSNLYKTLTENVKTGYYVGMSLVAGVPTHHLVFSQDNIDWQIWIEDGKQPLPRKIVITYKNLPGSPQYTAIFSEWDFNPLEESLFTFTPPKQAVRIEVLPVANQ